MRWRPFLLTGSPVATGTLTGVAVHDGLALVAGGGGHRVDLVGTGTNWTVIAPTATVDVGSLGAITVDTDTTAHATYTSGAGSGTTTVTCTSHGGTATLTVLAAATGYSLTGPASGQTGIESSVFTVTLTPSGAAADLAVIVTPTIGPDGTVSGTTTLFQRTADASGTFTVTPAADGAHTVSTSDNRGLTDPTPLTYTSSTPAAMPGAPVIGTAVAGILAMTGAWTNGATNGTTTINHDAQLEIDGVAGAVIESIGLTSPHTFTGLSVGASVKVRFRTIGQLGVAEAISDWSAYSSPAVIILAPTPSTSTTSSGPTRPRMTGRVRGTARVGGAHRAVGTRRLVTR